MLGDSDGSDDGNVDTEGMSLGWEVGSEESDGQMHTVRGVGCEDK